MRWKLKKEAAIFITLFIGLLVFSATAYAADDSTATENKSFFSSSWAWVRNITVISNYTINCTVNGYNIEDIVHDETDLTKLQIIDSLKRAQAKDCLTEEHLNAALKEGLINKTEKQDLQESIGLYQYIKVKAAKGSDSAFGKVWWLLGSRDTWPEFFLDMGISFLFILPVLFFLLLYAPFTIGIETSDITKGVKKITPFELYHDQFREGVVSSIIHSYTELLFDKHKSAFFFRITNIRFIVVILYFILSFLPITNRILQIASLELFGLPWVLRALFIATLISFIPYIFRQYERYKTRRDLYKKQLERIAAEEVAKTMLRG